MRALAKLTHLRFSTRHMIEGTYAGRHRSRKRGGAGEFADYREYVEGEDLRRLDWKLLARSNRAYIRLYQEETNLLCTLVLDASASMRFGEHQKRLFAANTAEGGSKLSYVQHLATAFSQLIANQQDQVGLAVIADRLTDCIPAGSTAGHVKMLHDAIANMQTAPGTDLAAGLHSLFTRGYRRGVLLVMSDFLVDDLEATFAPLRLFRHSHWEVVLLHIVHPDEERLPAGLAYRFEGLEGDGRVDCSPQEVRAEYEKRFENHAAMVRSLALSTGCDYRRISTATPYLSTLRQFLVERTA